MSHLELPEVAQEQMLRWFSPEELSRMYQQMKSNPDLMRWTTELMKNLRTDDFKRATERMQHVRSEDLAKITELMVKSKPEQIAAMKAYSDAKHNYGIFAANLLKQEGNELHNRGKYHEAASKYKLAKYDAENLPFSAASKTLQSQCSLNLMSCYLKTGQFNECINEGTEVLSHESKNVKALYRRGQAYRELGNFEAAFVDLKKAYENSPDDETIAHVLRDVVQDKHAEQKWSVSICKEII